MPGSLVSTAMGLLYKPFSIIAKLLSKRAGGAAFASVWANLGDGERPPAANASRRSLTSVFWTSALQAAILAGIAGVIDQLIARVFHQIFGAWPGRPVQPAGQQPPLDKVKPLTATE